MSTQIRPAARGVGRVRRPLGVRRTGTVARRRRQPSLDTLTPSLKRAPELLRDLIRFGHAERGLRPELTAAALDTVDEAAGPFLQAVHELDDEDH